ncbi:hypothetical protein CUJ84_pRLN1000649 (plasmid) [Rhizobium leguminosarum]|uniref:Uncharacterized protein n=1 Tax=Rhizobium leguminosarum TaxID=384 RepID=A0A2K9ZCY2_RHILE|nr:hypothetical protein CUJ84_pRLN1000649 [Rhizobium leguminosarum]
MDVHALIPENWREIRTQVRGKSRRSDPIVRYLSDLASETYISETNHRRRLKRTVPSMRSGLPKRSS